MFLKVYDYCEAVIHLESSHTRVPQQTNEDKETITIIQRLGGNTRQKTLAIAFNIVIPRLQTRFLLKSCEIILSIACTVV